MLPQWYPPLSWKNVQPRHLNRLKGGLKKLSNAPKTYAQQIFVDQQRASGASVRELEYLAADLVDGLEKI